MYIRRMIQQAILLLTVVSLRLELCAEAKQPADFLVQDLQDVEPAFQEFQGQMYSGLLPMDNKNRHGKLMFWLFAPDSNDINKTLTVWSNGGPGCSSFFAGVFFEHGPVTIPLREAGTCCVGNHEPFMYNPHTWASETHLLYVEQPVGVGFSDGEPEPQDERDVAGDFSSFLENFYQVFTVYQDYELYLFGESYAGMYVPSIAHEIYKRNVIQLTGIGIGNGLLDSRVQGPVRIDYAYYHGFIDSYTRDVLTELWNQCSNSKQDMREPFHSFNVPDDCGMLSAIPLAAGRNAMTDSALYFNGPNVYDVTTWDPYAILTRDDNSISRFYNNPAVKAKLHAPNDTFWRGCIPGAGRRARNLMATLLIHDKPNSTVPYIAKLLDGGIRVLLYNGDRDMACNLAGTEQLLNSMEWSGHDEWYTTPRGLWTVNGKPAGYAKSFQNLNFVVLYNSGHLVPYNQPVNALDLLSRFLTNTSFYDYNLPNFGEYVKEPNEKFKRHSETVWNEALISQTSFPQPTMSPLSIASVLSILLAFVIGFGVAYFWQRHSSGYRRI